MADATSNALSLKYLGGGHGQGCNESDDAFTLWRRRWHHFTFYGFMLCFAATCVATRVPLFVQLGRTVCTDKPAGRARHGGRRWIADWPGGLAVAQLRRRPQRADSAQNPMDRGFIALLLLASVSGLALLAWRDTGAMALLLALHLGVVMALFLMLPCGKFAHGIFRAAALLKWNVERRQPNTLLLSDD